MKKSLIPVLLIVVVLAGCEKKQASGTSDSGSAPPATAAVGIVGNPTIGIMPPSVRNGQAGNLTLTLPANKNNALISVLFLGGDLTQTVTISNGATLIKTITAAQAQQWVSFPINSTDSILTITIAASMGNPLAPYPNVVSAPVAAGPNSLGLDATAYSDAGGTNKAVIAITDLCGIQ